MQATFVRRELVNYEQGGYYHVYRSRDAEAAVQRSSGR